VPVELDTGAGTVTGSRPLRILVTGSRAWDNEDIIRDAILGCLGEFTSLGLPVLVHGGCPLGGADWIADRVWRDLMARPSLLLAEPEVHDANDHRSFRHRNEHMVKLGATACLSFALGWSSGTGQTARLARAASIPVRDYGVDTRQRARITT
jgi:hypothetical protein